MRINNIIKLILGLASVSSICTQASQLELNDDNNLPRLFRQAVVTDRKILLVHLNDFYADADSIMAACHTLISIYSLNQQYPNLDIKLAFGSTDEFNIDTLQHCNQSIQQNMADLIRDKGQHYADQHPDNLQQHYQQLVNHFEESTPVMPFRIQDAAITLFPLAERLKLNIELFVGDIRRQQKKLYPMTDKINVVENSNPYFGNFGVGLGMEDQAYIRRINTTQTLINLVGSSQQQQRTIFVHSGGSLTLLSELARHTDLAKHVNVLAFAFKQPIPKNDSYNSFPSHNESLNMAASQQFLKYAVNFNAVEIIDSNTGYYAPVCVNDLDSFDAYTCAMALDTILSPEAYRNLIETQNRHYVRYGKVSQSYMKFTDSLLMAYQMGAIRIPMLTQNYQRLGHTSIAGKDTFNYSLVPSQHGYRLSLPFLNFVSAEQHKTYDTHPFSKNIDNSTQQPQRQLSQQLTKDMLTYLRSQAQVLSQL